MTATGNWTTERYAFRREKKHPEWLILAMFLSLLFWIALGFLIFG
jgi:hypothetical protein